MIHVMVLGALLFSSLAAAAIPPGVWSDDRDLVPPTRLPVVPPALSLVADTSQLDGFACGAGAVRVVRVHPISGVVSPVSGLRFVVGTEKTETDADGVAWVSCKEEGAMMSWKSELRTQAVSIDGRDGAYSIQTDVPCGSQQTLLFSNDGSGGQALGIWQVVMRVRERLAASVGLDFWRTPVSIQWPGDGDYYAWGTVSITRGDYWDVVGHEVGHAVYDMGNIGGFAGGPHKIDECYTDRLAFSEGWASFFSAWVSIPLDESEAKFEFMVPRRAPLHIENVPGDVCASYLNEWRVTSFLWDLVDLHDDGEQSAAGFKLAWDALFGTTTQSLPEARELFERAGVKRETLDLLWQLNRLGAR